MIDKRIPIIVQIVKSHFKDIRLDGHMPIEYIGTSQLYVLSVESNIEIIDYCIVMYERFILICCMVKLERYVDAIIKNLVHGGRIKETVRREKCIPSYNTISFYYKIQ